MKKILLIFLLLLMSLSCTSKSADNYHIISNHKVDGYDIYEYNHNDFFCKTYYEDIYYSDSLYNYGFSFYGCAADMTFFIKQGNEYIYVQDALEQGFITLESLLPELEKLERHPEEISTEEADYYWLDFYINHKVVYAYAGGECNQTRNETFIIDGIEYYYSARGCLLENILYMRNNNEYVPVSSLLAEGDIDGQYLIPLLKEK